MQKSKKKSKIPIVRPVNRSKIPCRKPHTIKKKVIDRNRKHKDNADIA